MREGGREGRGEGERGEGRSERGLDSEIRQKQIDKKEDASLETHTNTENDHEKKRQVLTFRLILFSLSLIGCHLLVIIYFFPFVNFFYCF